MYIKSIYVIEKMKHIIKHIIYINIYKYIKLYLKYIKLYFFTITTWMGNRLEISGKKFLRFSIFFTSKNIFILFDIKKMVFYNIKINVNK